MEPAWIGFACPAHPTDARLDRDVGKLEAESTAQTNCCVGYTSYSIKKNIKHKEIKQNENK